MLRHPPLPPRRALLLRNSLLRGGMQREASILCVSPLHPVYGSLRQCSEDSLPRRERPEQQVSETPPPLLSGTPEASGSASGGSRNGGGGGEVNSSERTADAAEAAASASVDLERRAKQVRPFCRCGTL